MSNLEATAYVQIKKDGFHRGKVVKATQNKPARLEPGAIVVKVKFRVPSEVFEPFEPTAVIEISESLIQKEIEVEAVEA